MHYLSILAEHTDNISFSQLMGETSQEHPRGVLVLLVPGALGSSYTKLQLPVI